MKLNKREMLKVLAGGATAGSLAGITNASAETNEHGGDGENEVVHNMDHIPEDWRGNEVIAMLLYPGFTALDLVGPHYMLASLWGAKVHLVAKEKGPVKSDLELAIVANTTFEECPKDVTILFVPGAVGGAFDAMADKETMDFIKSRGERAEYVTSVCTGSLILGQAGLLDGYKATGHWRSRHLLSEFGATPVNERYVIDRNRITGAGVTAGIDFGLSIVERQRDTRYAKSIQLLAEYDPAPPLSAGTPEKAGPEVTSLITQMFHGYDAKVKSLARKRS